MGASRPPEVYFLSYAEDLIHFGMCIQNFFFLDGCNYKKMLRSLDGGLKSMFLSKAEPAVYDPGPSGYHLLKPHFLFCSCVN